MVIAVEAVRLALLQGCREASACENLMSTFAVLNEVAFARQFYCLVQLVPTYPGTRNCTLKGREVELQKGPGRPLPGLPG